MTTDLNARYGLNPAHSEVVLACQTIQPCDALEMGCGSGRNALYLNQLGFNVTAIDANPGAIRSLQSIVENEGLGNLNAQLYDIQDANLNASYGLIVCTVTLMFLDPSRIAPVIADMQACTTSGGYNLIVCAMNTEAHPCPVNFPFLMREGQLREFYKGWELLKYNEDLGTMHNGARLQFATMLARKPA